MMYINVTGTKHPHILRDISEAAEFYADILLDPRMSININLDIHITKNMDVQGECVCEDDAQKPRAFTIKLRNRKTDESIFMTLAHEMVHLKQHAKNEFGKEFALTDKGGLKIVTRWKGDLWKARRKECEYWDSPWEIEAYGRQVGLYQRWLEHKSKKNKKVLDKV